MIPVVIVARNTPDCILGAAIAARNAGALYDARFIEDEDLFRFFDRAVQRSLPPVYRLIILGVRPRRRSLSGRVVRHELIDALRSFRQPVTWVSAEEWTGEDRGAVAHEIGEKSLRIEPSPEGCAALALKLFGADDALAADLAGLEARQSALPRADGWRTVLDGLRADPQRLGELVDLLVRGMPDALEDETVADARAVLDRNEDLAASGMQTVELEDRRLAWLRVPADALVFREGIGAALRRAGDACFSLVAVPDRRIAILDADRAAARTCAGLARYLVDSLPGWDLEADRGTAHSLILPTDGPFDLALRPLLEEASRSGYVLHE